MRRACVERETAETAVTLELDLDGCGRVQVATGIPFLDHLLGAFALHGLFDLRLRARGDLEVDGHHTVEDVGICLGQAFRRAVGSGGSICRFGWCVLPMDEALVEVAVDAGGRPFLAYRVPVAPRTMGAFHTEMAAEFWRAFVRESGVTMHVSLRWGENSHHILEAVWKAAGVALRQAVREVPGTGGMPSTKGPVRTVVRRPGAAEEEGGRPAVGILDLGLGNLASVARAARAVGLGVRVSADPAELEDLAGLIVPGVGAFATAAARLQAGGGGALVRRFLARGRPVLGICLGMQVMCGWGEEGGGTPGLGLVDAAVRRLPPGLPVPHVGWNQVRWDQPLDLFRDLGSGSWFYFSHAYYVDGSAPVGKGDVRARTAVTEYGVPVLAALEMPPLYGVQFHPEKSGEAGLRLLAAFARLCAQAKGGGEPADRALP